FVRPEQDRRCVREDRARRRRPRGGARHAGPLPPAEPRLRARRGIAMAHLCGVIGIGQTKYDAKRIDVSMPGLLREAALRALEDAGLTFADIDAVVIGKAPDTFEGVMLPENYLADAIGATGKPLLRVHTAGSVGGSTANVAMSLIHAG